jgi:hypothetical protein
MEKKVPSFHKMCASPCYYSGNRWLRNIQASTPPFTDVHGPHLHEGTSKHEDLLKVWLKMCLYVLYKTCAGVNIDPMGQTFKKKEITDETKL